MQGVAGPAGRGGAGRGRQRLGQGLAAADPLRQIDRVQTPEDVLLDLLQVQQTNQFDDGGFHGAV